MNRPSRPVLIFLGLVAFSLGGSLLSRVSGLDPGPIAPAASMLTLGAGVVATFSAYAKTALLWRLGAALALGTVSELIGLASGFPFGRYTYTDAWWPTVRLPGLGPFPLLLPFAWLLMAGSARLALPFRGTFTTALLGGLLAAVVDLAMEPVMAGSLGYWHWVQPGPLPGGAPVANFFGWWAVASLAGLVLTKEVVPSDPVQPRWVLAGFVILILGLGIIK